METKLAAHRIVAAKELMGFYCRGLKYNGIRNTLHPILVIFSCVAGYTYRGVVVVTELVKLKCLVSLGYGVRYNFGCNVNHSESVGHDYLLEGFELFRGEGPDPEFARTSDWLWE